MRTGVATVKLDYFSKLPGKSVRRGVRYLPATLLLEPGYPGRQDFQRFVLQPRRHTTLLHRLPNTSHRCVRAVEPEGALVGRQPFAEIPSGASPDGATVDVDGCVWSAHWGSGSVVRYTPDGRVDRVIQLPTRQPSCVCFAGRDLDILCVTTAREDLDDSVLHAEPHAGDVFLYRVGTQGLPEPEYLHDRPRSLPASPTRLPTISGSPLSRASTAPKTRSPSKPISAANTTPAGRYCAKPLKC